MTIRAFKDGHDGYYQLDHVDGEPFPTWTIDLITCDVIQQSLVPTIPQIVTIRQARLALLQTGLLDQVNNVVSQTDPITKIEWEYATEIKRSWPTLLNLQNVLGLSDEQIDNLFILANSL